MHRWNVEEYVRSRPQWRQVCLGGLSRLMQRDCMLPLHTGAAPRLGVIRLSRRMLCSVDQEVCLHTDESKEAVRQGLHDMYAGQVRTQTTCSLAMLHT